MDQNNHDYTSIDIKEIEFLEGIGKGSFGVVYKCIWKNKLVAVKRVETESEVLALMNEVQQLSKVEHENIIKMQGAYMGEGEKFLVMEFADGGSLYQLLHNPPYPEYNLAHGISWLLQCAKGVAYLHSLEPHPVLHRDLKPPNLLLTNGWKDLKVCDFGTACHLHTEMTDNKGSVAWMAPEVFSKNTYNEKCDVYSWGIILWEVLTRKVPFQDLGQTMRILWAVYKGKRPPFVQECPKILEHLMNRCWNHEQSERPSMDEVVTTMTILSKIIKGVEEPIYFNNSPQDSMTDCIMSQLNNSSAGRTSQDVSEIMSMSATPNNITNREMTPTNDNLDIPRNNTAISPDVSALVVVDPMNSCSPMSTNQSLDCFPIPRTGTGASNYPFNASHLPSPNQQSTHIHNISHSPNSASQAVPAISSSSDNSSSSYIIQSSNPQYPNCSAPHYTNSPFPPVTSSSRPLYSPLNITIPKTSPVHSKYVTLPKAPTLMTSDYNQTIDIPDTKAPRLILPNNGISSNLQLQNKMIDPKLSPTLQYRQNYCLAPTGEAAIPSPNVISPSCKLSPKYVSPKPSVVMRDHLHPSDPSTSLRRHSAEVPPIDSSQELQPRHRRSSSQGSPTSAGWCEKTLTPTPFEDFHNKKSPNPGIEVERSAEPKAPRSNPDTDAESLGELWHYLEDNDLKPVMPLPTCQESIKIFQEHKEKAKEYLVLQEEIYTLRKKKEDLLKTLSEEEKLEQSNNHRYHDKIQKLQNKQDELIHCHKVLQNQITRIRKDKPQENRESERDLRMGSSPLLPHLHRPPHMMPGQSIYPGSDPYYLQPFNPPIQHFPYMHHPQYYQPAYAPQSSPRTYTPQNLSQIASPVSEMQGSPHNRQPNVSSPSNYLSQPSSSVPRYSPSQLHEPDRDRLPPNTIGASPYLVPNRSPIDTKAHLIPP